MKVSEVNDINIFAKVTFVYYYRSGIFELCHILEGFVNYHPSHYYFDLHCSEETWICQPAPLLVSNGAAVVCHIHNKVLTRTFVRVQRFSRQWKFKSKCSGLCCDVCCIRIATFRGTFLTSLHPENRGGRDLWNVGILP